jgi:hypothetical protein
MQWQLHGEKCRHLSVYSDPYDLIESILTLVFGIEKGFSRTAEDIQPDARAFCKTRHVTA